MDGKSLIPEKMKKMIGGEISSLVQTTEIDRTLVNNFIWAVEDPNSMWRGEEYDRVTEKYDGGKAPQGIIYTAGVSYKGYVMAEFDSELPPSGADVGGEWEIFKPVKVGDVITSRPRLAEVYERDSKSLGRVLVIVLDTAYTDQDGALVGKYKHIMWRWNSKQ